LWRRSLTFRVVTATVGLSILVVAVLGQVLVDRVRSGLLDSKERQSLDAARAGLSQAQAIVDAADPTDPASLTLLVDDVVAQLADRAGQPPSYEVLLLSGSPGSTVPERGSNLVQPDSLPEDLADAVRARQGQQYAYTELRYADARADEAAIAVGSPLSVTGTPGYELYFLFPLTAESDTLALVQRALTLAALVLLALLGGIAWLVTRQVTDPVRAAARIAEEYSAGRLTERMTVNGEDDLARLAASFNQMAGSLEHQIGRLEELAMVQRRFVSDVSHELRTPLTTVRMAADVLHEARTDFDPATARSAELLQTQLDRFEALLTDLLEISRYDAGAAVLEPERVDLGELAARVVEAAEPLAERRDVELQLHRPPVPVAVQADPRRVDRILRNLIGNAIEHAEGKPVAVTVASGSDSAAVGVRDHGAGLRPGEAALVFNRFWRADPARARTTGGTGLGLSIALEDARLHGGWLQAWGRPGEGANFRLTLPLIAGSEPTGSPLPLEPDDAAPGDADAAPPGPRPRTGSRP
jgi:two-component system sensor histidine kinase MtrB